MIENVLDRLEGIEKNELNQILLQLIQSAEKLGFECMQFLYENGTRDQLLKEYDQWQKDIDDFYEKYIK